MDSNRTQLTSIVQVRIMPGDTEIARHEQINADAWPDREFQVQSMRR
jgi:hypothetical protein